MMLPIDYCIRFEGRMYNVYLTIEEDTILLSSTYYYRQAYEVMAFAKGMQKLKAVGIRA